MNVGTARAQNAWHRAAPTATERKRAMSFLPLLLLISLYAAFLSLKLWNCIYAAHRMHERRRLQRTAIGGLVIAVLVLVAFRLWLLGLSASWAVLLAATGTLIWDVIADMVIFGVELPLAAATPKLPSAPGTSGAAQMTFSEGRSRRIDLWRYLIQLKVGRG